MMEAPLITPKMLHLIARLDEAEWQWQALRTFGLERMLALRHSATIESIGSSTRIEGVRLSNHEVERLLASLIRRPRDPPNPDPAASKRRLTSRSFRGHVDAVIRLLTGMIMFFMPGASAMEVSDPAGNGQFPTYQTTVSIPGTQGANLSADLYYPGDANGLSQEAGRCPVIVLGHGFSQSKANHANQGLHLATRGYIVLIPNSNSSSDHSRFADDLIKCIDWMEQRNNDPGSVFHALARVDRVGVGGHSAGGLSAILAASRDTRIRAVSTMDPVDNGGLGEAALPGISAPVAITYSEPSNCNANGSALVLYNAAVAPKRGIKIVGANHSDPQDPASFTSNLFCGSANSTRQALYRRYMSGWFEYHLRNDARYGPWVFNLSGGRLVQDLQANRITFNEIRAPMAAWRFVQFGVDSDNVGLAGDSADPDADGRSNLLEYAFNTDPLVPDEPGLPDSQLVELESGTHLAIRFPRVTAASDIIYQVESSDDLGEWYPGSSYSGSGETPVTETTTEVSREGAGLETLIVRDNSPVGAGAGFLRLSVSRR
jgi:dienelactone hydrolase